MSARSCRRCGTPLRDQQTVCDHCLDQLGAALGEIPWLAKQLEISRTRQRALPLEGGSTGVAADLTWHEAASREQTALHALLVGWVRLCEEEQIHSNDHADRAAQDTSASMSRWLLWRVHGIGQHDLGPEAVDQIIDAVDRGKWVIDRPPDRWYAGPCTDCGIDMYARTRTGQVACECGATYDVEERRAYLLAEAEDRLADATTIARAVSWLGAQPLSPSRVWKWAERGQLIARTHDGIRPLYRVGDAIDLLAQTEQRRA